MSMYDTGAQREAATPRVDALGGRTTLTWSDLNGYGQKVTGEHIKVCAEDEDCILLEWTTAQKDEEVEVEEIGLHLTLPKVMMRYYLSAEQADAVVSALQRAIAALGPESEDGPDDW